MEIRAGKIALMLNTREPIMNGEARRQLHSHINCDYQYTVQCNTHFL